MHPGVPKSTRTHVMAPLPVLWGKTKQFHQVTSRKFYYWNNLSHVIALQNQPLCTRIYYNLGSNFITKRSTDMVVIIHASLVGQVLKASTVQACRRNLTVMTLNFAQTLTILFIVLSCTRTRGSLQNIDSFCSCMCITWELDIQVE